MYIYIYKNLIIRRDDMNIRNTQTINTPSIHYRDNVIYKANEEFLQLTGCIYEEIIGKSIEELSNLLKTNINIDFKNDNTLSQGYIFTSRDHPKYVEVRSSKLSRENEAICFFDESPSEFLNGVLATCLDNFEDKREAKAIYSYPDLIHLKVNKTHIKNSCFFDNDKSTSIGSKLEVPKQILDYIEENGSFYIEEKETKDKYGSSTYFTIKANLIYDNDKAKYLKVSFIDETEKVLIRKNIQKQKDEMEIILDHMPDSMVKLNRHGDFTYSNKVSKEKLSSYSSDENPLNIKEYFEIFKYNDISGGELSFDETPEARALKGEIIKDHIVITTCDLGTFYHKSSGTPIYDDNGRVEGAVMLYRDIDDIIELEEWRALSENLKNLNVNYTAISSDDFKVKYANESAIKSVVNIDPSISHLIDFIGKDFFDHYINTPKEKKELIDKINLHVKKNHTKYVHKQRIIIEEEVIYFKTIFQPVFDSLGQIEQISCVGINITDEELDKQQLTNSLKAQDEVFVNTSHELKTPINLIFSASQMLSMHLKSSCSDCKKNNIARNNQIITQNCYRSIKLINNILDVSKMEHGFTKLNLKNKNIVDIIDNMVMSVSDYIKNKNLSIIFDPKIEEKIMGVDLYNFERIMLNLISNAIKFSNDGGIIFIDLIDKITSVEISIKDQGIGIDENNLTSIFNKFKQEDKSLNRNAEGTGVGLYLVKSMIDLHGGSIAVESSLNLGTKFTIDLPVVLVEEAFLPVDDYNEDDRVDMIRFELSDIYD